MSKKPWLAGTLAVVFGLCCVAPAMGAWTHRGERNVSFKAVGPGGLGIEGKGNDVSIKERSNQIVVAIGLANIKTGIDLRDRHMHEKYLETNKYPQAVFSVDKSSIKAPGSGEVEGKLQLHGVTKPVKVKYQAVGKDNQVTVTGSARINMKEFGIEVPSYLGVTVKPDVTVSLRFDAVDS